MNEIATYDRNKRERVSNAWRGQLMLSVEGWARLAIPDLEYTTIRRPAFGHARGLDKRERQRLYLKLRINAHEGERQAIRVREGDLGVAIEIEELTGVDVGANVQIVGWRVEDPEPELTRVELLLRDQL